MIRELERVPSSIPESRNLSREWATLQSLNADTIWSLELVVSELVTNALRHGEGVITLRLSMIGASARVEVDDQGPRLPVYRSTKGSHTEDGGRGLPIVKEL